MNGFVKIATTDKLTPGKMITVKINNVEVVVGNNNGNYFAMEEICSHEGGPLHEGYFENSFVVCPWHAAKYDVKTGKADASTPWGKKQKIFQVKIEGNDILVKV
ncbi:MAG: Rieske 2Fe-2S domain-containing protein [Candidatus Aenigmarchaeota archaeon]|nr:Rieske 2Fe-2S domain-containing protein [Candidatus Aenigmarchaeota archaeon]